MFMDELFEITKDYFKKSNEEKHLIFLDIFLQLNNLIVESNLDLERVQIKLLNLQEKSVENEMYELAELYKKLNHELNELYGRV